MEVIILLEADDPCVSLCGPREAHHYTLYTALHSGGHLQELQDIIFLIEPHCPGNLSISE